MKVTIDNILAYPLMHSHDAGDISGLSTTYVPYTNAVADVDLGVHRLTTPLITSVPDATPGAGVNLDIFASAANTTDTSGGVLTFGGGNGNGTGAGGNFTMYGGYGGSNGAGGIFTMMGGTGQGTGNGGDLYIQGGSSAVTGNPGSIYLYSNDNIQNGGAQFDTSILSANRLFTFPNHSGNILVDGADVDLGIYDLKATDITATNIIIGANTLNTTEWAFLDGQDQAVKTTSTPQFLRLGIGQAASATIAGSITGDLDIRNGARTGTHATPVGLYVTGGFGEVSGGAEFRHSNGTQGIGIGYAGIYACGSNTDQNLKLIPKGTGKLWVKDGAPDESIPLTALIEGISAGVTTTQTTTKNFYANQFGYTIAATGASTGNYTGLSGTVRWSATANCTGTVEGLSGVVAKNSTSVLTTMTGLRGVAYMEAGSGGVTTANGLVGDIVGVLGAGTITTAHALTGYARYVNGTYVTNFNGLYLPNSSACVTGTYQAILSDYGNSLLKAGAATIVPLTIKGAASQTADLLNLLDSSSNTLLESEADGELNLTQDSKYIRWGAGLDMGIFYDGTDGSINTSLVAPSDLNITCGANKTLELQNVVYDDMQFAVSFGKVNPANTAPNWETFTATSSEYAFSVNDEVDTQASEIPHWWKEGTAGNVHMHITTKAVPAAQQYAKFTVTFAYADTNEVWVEAPLTAELTIPISTTALTNFYLDLGDLTLTNYLVGVQMKCRVKRIAATGGTEYVGDIFITQVGVHLSKDTLGSRQEIIK